MVKRWRLESRVTAGAAGGQRVGLEGRGRGFVWARRPSLPPNLPGGYSLFSVRSLSISGDFQLPGGLLNNSGYRRPV